MAALTGDRDTPKKHCAYVSSGPVAAAAVIYAGALVCRDADGYLIPASDTAGIEAACGRACHAVDNTDGADGDEALQFEAGIFGFGGSAGLIADGDNSLGASVTIVDDQTVGLAAGTTNDIVAGKLMEIDGTTFYVAVGMGL